MLPMSRKCWMLLGWGVMLLLSACHHKKDDTKARDTSVARTVVIYMVAENSLYEFVRDDILEMLAAKSSLTNNDHLVLYLDNEDEARIFIITNKTKATKYAELKPAYTFPQDPNSSSPAVLKEVLSYVQKKCPADEYGLVFWSHASGWISSTFAGDKPQPASRRSFGVDNGKNTDSNSGSQMNINDMAEVLTTFPKFRFILFDACFMQCVEVAYELRHCTKYLIGSPAEIPGPGAPYHKIIPQMFDDSKLPVDIAKAYFDYYSPTSWGSLLSVIDCSQLDDFAHVTRPLIARHRDELLQGVFGNRLNYFAYEQSAQSIYSYPDYYDIQGLMQSVLSAEEYKEWKNALDHLSIASYHTSSWFSAFPVSTGGGMWPVDETQYSGLSMFVPLEKYKSGTVNFTDDYQSTSWAKEVWN